MLYTYKEAIEQNIINNSVRVVMQAKNVPIHQGHINLINFAKQYGNVVVIIRDFKWLMTFCLYGMPESQVIPELMNVQLESLKPLGVNIIYQGEQQLKSEVLKNMTNEVQVEWLNSAKEKVKPFEDQLILQRKINLCIIQEMRIKIWNSIYGTKIPFSYSVTGLDVDYFYSKVACLGIFTNWPNNRILYPYRDIDPETGFNYQYANSILTLEQKKSCLELREIIEGVKHSYVKGLNTELVDEINSKYPNKLWKMNDIAVLRDGIFGTSVLECLSFSFNQQPDLLFPKPEFERRGIFIDNIDKIET